MKTKDAVRYFGGDKAALAHAVGLSRQAVYLWRERVPPLSQIKLYRFSGGALKPEPYIMALLAPLPRKRKTAGGEPDAQAAGRSSPSA